ncbi:hypothetical protein [Candidatus Vampirococcus lugosii]|nr:hypothetical protein [Candidatus Vampirococcus lugosii]
MFITVIGIISFIVLGYFKEQESIDVNKQNLNNINFINFYLQKNYNGNYPKPYGDVVLLDSNFNKIHLEDSTVSYENIPDLYAIQGTTCSLGINDEEFNKYNYDIRYSVGENKRCYSYSVLNDNSEYQIGYIQNINNQNIGYLTGSIDISKSITKSYNSSKLVKNSSTQTLPYMPSFNNKIILEKISGNADIEVIETSKDLGKIDLGNLNNDINLNDDVNILPHLDNVEQIDLSFEGKEFVYKIIYPNGNLQIISPNKNSIASLSIKDFYYDGEKSKFKILDNVGRIAYDFVKLGGDSDYEISDSNSGVLVIRGTKFSLDSDSKSSLTHLSKGSIEYNLNGKKYLVNSLANLFFFDQNMNLLNINDLGKDLSNLLGYSIAVSLLDYEIDLEYVSNHSASPELPTIITDNLELSKNFELNNDYNKYGFFVFDGNLTQSIQKNLVISGKYLNDEFDNICKSNGFNGLASIDDAKNILDTKVFSDDKITFEIKEILSDKINKNYDIIFNKVGNSPSNTKITYFNSRTGFIDNTNYIDSSGTGRDGSVVFCK